LQRRTASGSTMPSTLAVANAPSTATALVRGLEDDRLTCTTALTRAVTKCAALDAEIAALNPRLEGARRAQATQRSAASQAQVEVTGQLEQAAELVTSMEDQRADAAEREAAAAEGLRQANIAADADAVDEIRLEAMLLDIRDSLEERVVEEEKALGQLQATLDEELEKVKHQRLVRTRVAKQWGLMKGARKSPGRPAETAFFFSTSRPSPPRKTTPGTTRTAPSTPTWGRARR